MPSGEITSQDIESIRALRIDVSTTVGQVDSATAPLNGLAARVEQLIGGTATGKDREFAQRLQKARLALTAATHATSDAAHALGRAEQHAEQLLREQQERERERERSQVNRRV